MKNSLAAITTIVREAVLLRAAHIFLEGHIEASKGIVTAHCLQRIRFIYFFFAFRRGVL